MIKTGLQNESLISELQISGSLAIKTKNQSGIYFFEQKNPDSGVISGKLDRPKYNESELKKSIDTTIVELIPIEPPPVEETVPKPIYDEALVQIQELTTEVTQLNSDILDLRAKVTELEIVTQSLRIDVDGQTVLAASSQNQGEQANIKVQSSVIELSNAIQKATSEAIQRVSLTARTQALEEQNKTYKEEIEGKAAKIAEGHKGSGDITFKIVKRDRPDDKDLRVEVTSKLEVQWINGPDIEIYNPKDTAVTVEVKDDTQNLLKETSPITIQPKETKTLKLVVDTAKAAEKNPKGSGGLFGGLIAGKDQDYDGNITLVNPGGRSLISFRLFKKKK